MQKEEKTCSQCGSVFLVEKKNKKRKFCSVPCFRKSRVGKKTWNYGKTGYLSDDSRKKMSENAKRNIEEETPEQRERRMQQVMRSREENGIWKSPKLGKIGKEDSQWLGDDATYNAKHRWIQKHWKKTGICEFCKLARSPFGNRRYGTEWANVSGEYDRENRGDWKELCVKCHRNFDKKQ